jgi:hypothetical protein
MELLEIIATKILTEPEYELQDTILKVKNKAFRAHEVLLEVSKYIITNEKSFIIK